MKKSIDNSATNSNDQPRELSSNENVGYVSEATIFLNDMKKKDPNLHKKQLKLRSTWWDQDANCIEESRLLRNDSLRFDAYHYYTYKSN